MQRSTPLEAFESAGAAGRILKAIRGGVRDELERELKLAEQICSEPVHGDSAEAERRELLKSIAERFRLTHVTRDRVSSTCLLLLGHLQASGARSTK